MKKDPLKKAVAAAKSFENTPAVKGYGGKKITGAVFTRSTAESGELARAIRKATGKE
ncbi:hypothetical protein BMS3Abin15_00970 [bacterium BMS3Abin15]|nr:hypothetical protein BMS3Abin15_00970 [bacterium BMS3Abin15]